MRILHAVNKSLDQITVAEICRNAGISRQTYYRHFEQVRTSWWYSIFCRQFYLNEIGRTIDWKTGATTTICAHRPGARFLPRIHPVLDQHALRADHHAGEPQTFLFDTLENYRHVEVNDNLRFIVEILETGCGVMNDWFRSDEPIDLVRWTDDLVSLVPDRLYRALEIPSTDR